MCPSILYFLQSYHRGRLPYCTNTFIKFRDPHFMFNVLMKQQIKIAYYGKKLAAKLLKHGKSDTFRLQLYKVFVLFLKMVTKNFGKNVQVLNLMLFSY